MVAMISGVSGVVRNVYEYGGSSRLQYGRVVSLTAGHFLQQFSTRLNFAWVLQK